VTSAQNRFLPFRARVVGLSLLIAAAAAPALGQQRHAVIVSGATGGPLYAAQYREWSEALAKILTDAMKFDPARVVSLSETDESLELAATAANVRRHLAALRRTLGRDDLLLVVLIGHGTFDGIDAKFNLVGRDMESAEWAALLRGMPGRLVVVNSAAASFPFLERLAGPRRIIISATDSVAQRFDTVFPQHFVAALSDAEADIDKNGRISIWEAFAFAGAGVRRHYQQRGQLSTERPLLDDNGDGVGREAAGAGEDGSLASRTYLDEAAPDAPPTDEVLLQLLQKRAALEAEVDELKVKKTFMQPGDYAAEFERIMIELAKISRDVRGRMKTTPDSQRPTPHGGWTDRGERRDEVPGLSSFTQIHRTARFGSSELEVASRQRSA
jgi:hypothetical protein